MTTDTTPVTPATTPAQAETRVAPEAPKAEEGGQRRRQRGGRGRRRNGNPQQAAARPQQHRGPREKATIANRLELAQREGDQERIGRLVELAEWKRYLEVIKASESLKEIAAEVIALREHFAEPLAAQKAYRNADDAFRAAVTRRDERIGDLHTGDNPPDAEEMGNLAKAVREAEAAKHEAIRLVRENSVGLDLYYELLRVLPPPPSRDERRGQDDRPFDGAQGRRNADRPRGNRPRGGKQIAGQAAPVNGGLSVGREDRNRERIAREAKDAEARRKAFEAERIAEAEAVAAFLVCAATPTVPEVPKGPAVERLKIEGLGGLTNGVFHMPDDPAPATSAAKLS